MLPRPLQPIRLVLHLGGRPDTYPRGSIPVIDCYPDGQTVPSPKAIDFNPGELLGSVSGALGLPAYLEREGNTLVVTSDKDGPACKFERELVDADVALENGQLAGYAGDVGFPQPAPNDHPGGRCRITA